MTPQEIITVLQGFSEGKKLEYRTKGYTVEKAWNVWPHAFCPMDFSTAEYRIMQVPKEFWIATNRYGEGVNTWGFTTPYTGGKPTPDAIRVREVIE